MRVCVRVHHPRAVKRETTLRIFAQLWLSMLLLLSPFSLPITLLISYAHLYLLHIFTINICHICVGVCRGTFIFNALGCADNTSSLLAQQSRLSWTFVHYNDNKNNSNNKINNDYTNNNSSSGAVTAKRKRQSGARVARPSWAHILKALTKARIHRHMSVDNANSLANRQNSKAPFPRHQHPYSAYNCAQRPRHCTRCRYRRVCRCAL